MSSFNFKALGLRVIRNNLQSRFADAWCAFHYGHSRRDLKRVKIRRLTVLTQRHIRHHLGQATIARVEQGECGPAVASLELALAQSFIDPLECLGNRVDGDAYCVLLNKIEFQRYDLNAIRISERVNLGALNGTGNAHGDLAELSVICPGGKHYGKLYKGLAKGGVFNALDNKLGLGVGYWHNLVSPLGQVIRNFRAAKKNKHSDAPP